MSHAGATSQAGEGPARHTLYVPGYAGAKLGLAALGLVLLLLSLDRLGPLLKLAAGGGSATAEVVRVVRTDAGGEAGAYTTDADVLTAVKAVETARDRESVFWNEYRFTTPDGRTVVARGPVGQHLRPVQPVRDENGLPSTARVWYDPADPRRIAMPLWLGTWFVPGIFVLFGGLALVMGLLLWWNAKKPIEMPDLSQSHGEVGA